MLKPEYGSHKVLKTLDFMFLKLMNLNPLAYTAVRETAGLARSINTQPAVRRSEPSMSFAFNSSLLSADGMTCLIPFESLKNALSIGVSYV